MRELKSMSLRTFTFHQNVKLHTKRNSPIVCAFLRRVRVKCRLHDRSIQVASVSCAEMFRDVDAIFEGPLPGIEE